MLQCTYDRTSNSIVSVIECSIVLLAGCAPTVYSFWSKFVVKSVPYMRIQSIASQVVLTVSQKFKRTQASRDTSENSDIHIRPMTTSPYFRLNENFMHNPMQPDLGGSPFVSVNGRRLSHLTTDALQFEGRGVVFSSKQNAPRGTA